jgi:IS605 OrfB family transposase
MIRTFETRIAKQDDRQAPVLNDLAERMCIAERKIYAFLVTGREWKAEYYRHIYRSLGLSSVMFRSAKDSLDGKLASISELAKVQSIDLQVKIDAKQAQIKAAQDQLIAGPQKLQALQQKRSKLTAKADRIKFRLNEVGLKESQRQALLKQLKTVLNKIDLLSAESVKLVKKLEAVPFNLHQHKRRLAILQLQFDRAEVSIKSPRICFGTKKLARKQNNLALNDYESHAEWKEEWIEARNRSFQFVGVAKMEGGNEVAKLKLRKDGLFDLELRLPPGVRHVEDDTTVFEGMSFNHGHDAIVVALASRQPLTIRFVKDDISWKVHVTIDQPDLTTRFEDDLGCLGVDFNADHVSATLADRFGNPIWSWNIPMVTYGLSIDQAKDLTRKVAKQVARIATEQNVPISAESLDFSRKKAQLTSDTGPRYARMLSSLAYSSFHRALASACARSSIHLKLVNPAFTSLIGRTKFAHRYGLSVHAAAALTIARRAMGFSENLPKPVDGKLMLPLDDGDRVTLPRPVRIEGRHVWSSWRKLNTGYKTAHAAHRLARRKSRSMELTPDGPNSGMAFKGRVFDPLPVGISQGVPG